MDSHYQIDSSGRMKSSSSFEVRKSGNSSMCRCRHAGADIGRVSKMDETDS